jgi:hypothetical protein
MISKLISDWLRENIWAMNVTVTNVNLHVLQNPDKPNSRNPLINEKKNHT